MTHTKVVRHNDIIAHNWRRIELMFIIKKRNSLSKKIHLVIKNNIFSSITKKQIERIGKLINLEKSRGYSISLSSYDWRICLIQKQIHPIINIILLLPDLVVDPEYSIPKNNFYSKYKHEFFLKHGIYGNDCDWFFSFNPKKYNFDLKAIKNSTRAEKIKITKSCKKTSTKTTSSGLSFFDYTDYSYHSKNMLCKTWNHKFKNHLVSMADYFQLEQVVNNTRARKALKGISEAAKNAENESSMIHRKSIEYFNAKLKETPPLPNIEDLVKIWKYPVVMDKLSGIYFAKGDIENYIKCKKIQLNVLLSIHEKKPTHLTESTLLNFMYSHLVKETSFFRIRNIEDEKFSQLVNDKNLALVGSASSTQLQGKEIDEFDIVSRMNFTVNSSDNILHSGIKTDILYKSTSIIKDLKDAPRIKNDQIFYNYLSNVPFISKEGNSRALFELRKNLLTMPNSVPRSLIDLMFFAPQRIKVFNCTLYANIFDSTTYDNKYREKLSKQNIKNLSFTQEGKLLSNFFHDFALNFLIMKCMYINNVYEADSSLENVLSMNLENYIKNLFFH